MIQKTTEELYAQARENVLFAGGYEKIVNFNTYNYAIQQRLEVLKLQSEIEKKEAEIKDLTVLAFNRLNKLNNANHVIVELKSEIQRLTTLSEQQTLDIVKLELKYDKLVKGLGKVIEKHKNNSIIVGGNYHSAISDIQKLINGEKE